MRQFKLTEQHILLLSRMYIRFDGSCEWGSIGSDCKRPFGNSDVVADMAEILGVEPVATDDGDYLPPGTSDKMADIYENELPTALKIILTTKSFEPGLYERGEYTDDWKKSQNRD